MPERQQPTITPHLDDDEEIFDRLNSNYYWFKCNDCGFETEYYLKQRDHRKDRGHTIEIKSVSLEFIENQLKLR